MTPDDASGDTTTQSGDATTQSGEASDVPTADRTGGDDHRREVVVPLSLYKVVTVFSTLLAVVLVVGGMIALDESTGRSTLEPDEISLPLAAVGVTAIVLGAGVYAFSTRFRAEGMGNPKEDSDEDSNDG